MITYLLSFCGKRVGKGWLGEANEEIQLEGDSTPVGRKLESGKDGAGQKKSSVKSVTQQERASESKAGGLWENILVPCCHRGVSRAKTKQGILPSCSKYPQLSLLSLSPARAPVRRQPHSPPGLMSLQHDPSANSRAIFATSQQRCSCLNRLQRHGTAPTRTSSDFQAIA